MGVPEHVLDRFVDAVTDPGYQGDAVDDVALMAPSVVTDVEFRSWWKLAGQRGASPAIARASNVLAQRADIRSVLPLIKTPTLVLYRVDNAFVRIGHGRYLAENIAGAKLIELPGRDHLPFVGDTDAPLGEIEEFLTGTRGTPNTDRVLATILFTDIVDSTKRAAGTGDRRWRDLLDNHDRMTERQVRRFGGRPVKSTGDGMLATFDGPARAIQSGLAICDGARQLGIEVRVGVHAGEVERRGGDIAGISVNIAARVETHAQPGEVWVSRTVTDLVADRGSSSVLEASITSRASPAHGSYSPCRTERPAGSQARHDRRYRPGAKKGQRTMTADPTWDFQNPASKDRLLGVLQRQIDDLSTSEDAGDRTLA